jgi:hypothetical protein
MITKSVVKTTLNVLNQCDGYPLAEKTLFIQTNIELDAMAVSTSELKEHLVHCKSKGWVDYMVDEIDGSKKWFITDAGKVVRA